jgi:threonylcarbamoyladenosine tRNA methylthiotransferase MtaB
VALEIKKVVEAGYNEVVLTGIHLGQWGQDLSPAQTGVDLLKFLEQNGILAPRLRLSSLEPSECTPDLIDYLKDKEWFCHHFHIPLQSGDSEILQLMGRPYDPAFYADVVRNIRAVFPDAAIGADVIVGFPGETEEMFRRTYELIESLPLTYLHVFPYSPRKGTPAAALRGRLSGQEIKSRVSRLRKLGSVKKSNFMLSQVGRELDVILESQMDDDLWRATSGNYLSVLVMNCNKGMPKGSLAKIRVTEYDVHRNMLVGMPV